MCFKFSPRSHTKMAVNKKELNILERKGEKSPIADKGD